MPDTQWPPPGPSGGLPYIPLEEPDDFGDAETDEGQSGSENEGEADDGQSDADDAAPADAQQ